MIVSLSIPPSKSWSGISSRSGPRSVGVFMQAVSLMFHNKRLDYTLPNFTYNVQYSLGSQIFILKLFALYVLIYLYIYITRLACETILSTWLPLRIIPFIWLSNPGEFWELLYGAISITRFMFIADSILALECIHYILSATRTNLSCYNQIWWLAIRSERITDPFTGFITRHHLQDWQCVVAKSSRSSLAELASRWFSVTSNWRRIHLQNMD